MLIVRIFLYLIITIILYKIIVNFLIYKKKLENIDLIICKKCKIYLEKKEMKNHTCH